MGGQLTYEMHRDAAGRRGSAALEAPTSCLRDEEATLEAAFQLDMAGDGS